MKKPVVYIAGPFRAPNAWEVEQNIRKAETLALELWKMGCAVICPHANTRFFSGAAPDEVWLDGDLEILKRCDAVVMVDGWEKSDGSRHERKWAIKLGIKVLDNWPAVWDWLQNYKATRRYHDRAADAGVY